MKVNLLILSLFVISFCCYGQQMEFYVEKDTAEMNSTKRLHAYLSYHIIDTLMQGNIVWDSERELTYSDFNIIYFEADTSEPIYKNIKNKNSYNYFIAYNELGEIKRKRYKDSLRNGDFFADSLIINYIKNINKKLNKDSFLLQPSGTIHSIDSIYIDSNLFYETRKFEYNERKYWDSINMILNQFVNFNLPEDKGKQQDSKAQAVSALAFVRNIVKIGDSNLKYDIYPFFIRNKSFIRFKISEILEHEQVHFDLYEVCARKIRKQLIDTIKQTINIKPFDENEIDFVITNFEYIIEPLLKELDIENDNFDNEMNIEINTLHTITNTNVKWQLKIKKDLSLLKKYEKNEGLIRIKP